MRKSHVCRKDDCLSVVVQSGHCFLEWLTSVVVRPRKKPVSLRGNISFKRWSCLFCCSRVNVTHFGDKVQCFPPVGPQNNYIVFAEMRANELVAKYDDLFGAAADWSKESENRVWTGVGECLSSGNLITTDGSGFGGGTQWPSVRGPR